MARKMNPDIRQQLMALTGVTDEEEFERMVANLASAASASGAEVAEGQSNGATETANVNCPFKVHFIQMLSILDAAPGDPDSSTENQIQHAYDLIFKQTTQFKDLKVMFKKKVEETAKEANSKALRDEGNKAYQKKDFLKALNKYTKSILCAPVDPSSGLGHEASLGLANRSAVFFEMKEHRKCLDDLEAAIMFGYPDFLMYKLHHRRARCLKGFGLDAEAAEAFREALKAVDLSNLKEESKRDAFRKEVNEGIASLKHTGDDKKNTKSEVGQREEHEEEDRKCPFEVWDRHPSFPPLADCLNIVYDDTVGRHVIATKPIRAGEPIVIEDPIAAHLSPYKMRENCCHCFRKLAERALPSPLLPQKARFCRLKCLKRALETYHTVESKVDTTEMFYGDDEESQLSGCISLAYRAVTQKNLDFFKEKRSDFFSGHDVRFGTEVLKGFSYVGDQHYKGLYNLVTHIEKASDRDRRTLLIRTVVLLRCLREAGYFPKSSSQDQTLTEDELFIGRLLLHFQMGIQYNLHTIYQVNGQLEAAKKIPLLDIGAGVYPTTLFFNHSCCPNTVRINQGTRVVFVAKSNIRAGEEVTDCYGIHHLSMPLKARQTQLRKGYAFDCACTGCRKNLSMLPDLPTAIPAKVAVKLGSTLSKYKSLFEEAKFRQALKTCQEYLWKLEELGVKFPHRNYEIGSLALCSCLWGLVKDV